MSFKKDINYIEKEPFSVCFCSSVHPHTHKGLPCSTMDVQGRAEDCGADYWGAKAWTGVLQLWCSSQLGSPYAAPLSCRVAAPPARPPARAGGAPCSWFPLLSTDAQKQRFILPNLMPPFPRMQQCSLSPELCEVILHHPALKWTSTNSDCSFDTGI